MLLAMVTACGRSQETKIDPAFSADNEGEPDVISFPESGKSSQDTGGSENYEKNKFLIEQKDADVLLTEALEGTDCKAVFEESLEIGDNGYYTYTVTDPQGEDMKDRLGVDGFSGQVVVLKDGKAEDFSSFAYYDRSSARNRDINWEGDFVLDNLTVSLVPADELSFEFSVFKKDEKLLSGVARIEGPEAFFESGEEKLEFKMTEEGTLQLVETGRLRISGQYTRQ